MPHVQIKAIKRVREHGKLVTYRPGDWVKVGKQTALEWIVDGSAHDPSGALGPALGRPKGGKPSTEYGLRIRGEQAKVDLRCVGRFQQDVSVSFGTPAVPYKYTLIWLPTVPASQKLVNTGFLRVQLTDGAKEAWEMAICLASDNLMAANVGSEEEQAKTLKAIGDLRLPIYNTDLIWVRRTKVAVKTIEQWAEYLAAGEDEQHSFLRTIYRTNPLICTLPPDWVSLFNG